MSNMRQPRSMVQKNIAVVCASLLSACVATTPHIPSDPVPRGNGLAPPGAPPGSCWSKVETPAVIETISQQVLVRPAKTNPDGTIAELPVYRTQARQQIVTPREAQWFETPCPPSFTVEFVSSLQRALIARGLYTGPVNGAMDSSTRAAILMVQREAGLQSDILSIETARALGLVVAAGLPA